MQNYPIFIEQAWQNRELLKEQQIKDIIREVIALLDAGKLRVAEPLENGSWQVNTPNSIQIHKAYNDLYVACKSGESSASKSFESKANEGAWGNILFGGLIGFLIDKNNGAGFDYPPILSLELDTCNDTHR
jgi:hypothetical protein